MHRFFVADGQAGERLDVFLTAALGADFSRTGAQRLIKEGYVVRAGGEAERNPAKKVRAGEVFEVSVPEVDPVDVVGEDIPLAVLYEDADLIVVDKPAGMAVHPSIGHWRGTLVHALLHHCKDLSGINGEMRPGIVHRIDKDTSGILVAAKHDRAHRGLAGQFARHTAERAYLAVVRGVPRPAAGRIEGNIGRHATLRVPRAVVASGGKPAVTHYKVVEAFGDGAALVECRLETGRTHQIRVHMAHRGHPLLGDALYGGKQGGLKGLSSAAVKGLTRQALHAAILGFSHPISGVKLRFESALPADLAALLQGLRRAD
jgi:23S rRNA pseudouridine1911/1915/1917 synthase